MNGRRREGKGIYGVRTSKKAEEEMKGRIRESRERHGRRSKRAEEDTEEGVREQRKTRKKE